MIMVRKLYTSSWLMHPAQVLVPSMGESIRDGNVVALLKGEGDSVKENDIVAQIETDKVTVDVRAPEDGVIEKLIVKIDDTVTPGQLLATLSPSPGALFTSKPSSAPPTPQPSPASTVDPARKECDLAKGRTPGIRFPPRRGPGGERLSLMTEEQRQQELRSPVGASKIPAGSVGTSSEGPPSITIRTETGHPIAPCQPAAASTAPQQRHVLPASPVLRRQLTPYEMEVIELGGAMP